MRFSVPWLLLVLAPAVSRAVTVPLPELGLRVAKNAKLLQGKREEVTAARLDAAVAGTLPNPSLATQLGTLKSGASQGVTVETTLTQTIPFPGKLAAQEKVRELEARLRELSVDGAALALEHEATLLGFRWSELEEESKHFRERQRRFQLIHDYLKTHPQVSPTQQVESELIQRQIGLLEKEFTELEDEKRSIGLELRYLLGVEDAVVVTPRWLGPGDLPERASLPPALVDGSPEVRALEADRDRAETELVLARKRTYPDVNVGLGYRLENVTPANHFFYGALSLSLPIFERGQSAVPAATARKDAREAVVRVSRDRIAMELERAWAHAETAGKVVARLPPSTAEETELQFQKVEREFRKGRIPIGLLLQSDAQLHQAVAAAYDAQVNFARRLSELYRLHGKGFLWR